MAFELRMAFFVFFLTCERRNSERVPIGKIDLLATLLGVRKSLLDRHRLL